MNLHEVYLAAQIAAKEVIKDSGSSKPIDTQVNSESENAVQNKAIYDFVNSSVANNTAYFKGTYNSVSELENITNATNNDYAFVVSIDIYGNTAYNRYKYNGNEWLFEYALNNSSFTANQWNTINSGITSADIQNLQDGKVDKIADKQLSTNDFTDAYKTKVDSLENYNDADVKAEVAKTAEQTALNRSTLGYQAKNLYKLEASSEVKAGVTFTVNGEFVNVTGTTTGSMTKYVFASSENPLVFDKDVIVSYTGVLSNLKFYVRRGVDSASYKYNSVPADGYKVTAGDKISGLYLQQQTSGLVVSANNFGVMIRDAEITDDTYEPNKPSVEERLAALEAAVFTAQSIEINNTESNKEATI